MSSFALSPGIEVRSNERTYTIQRVLGQGGFGITYLVKTNLKMGKLSFAAPFALKEHFIQVLCERDEATSRVHFLQSAAKEVEGSKRAFVSEAQRLQRLGIDHRNIVNVDEVFEANGTAYYVMEYLDGGSVANYVKEHGGRLSWAETTALMQPICEAVAMLHANRVAHYDIKPMNIMVMTDDQGLRPVLIDFGLAKHYDGQGEATSTIAAGGYTPGYAPMEQYGGLRQFSPTADVYALAATICFCLTGHAPAAAAELDLDALCDELLSLGVSDAVANVLLQALEYRPKARPADAGALAAALFTGVQQQTVLQTPQPAPENNQSVATVYMEPKSSVNYRTTPQNLDLQVTLNGKKYYFSQSEWANLSSSEQGNFDKCGLVIDYKGQRFVTALNMERHGGGYEYSEATWFTWDEAMQWFRYKGDGWRLPAEEEGKAMAGKYEAVCAAIKAFGGDEDSARWYWTDKECGTSSAWYFSLTNGQHNGNYKSSNLCVRAVRAI